MRQQGQARFGAACMVREAIAKEGNQAKPEYSLVVSYVIGSVILVLMLLGFYLVVRYGF